MEYLIGYIIVCLIVGYISDDTKLGFWPGLLLSLLLTPIGGFIIYLLYPAKQAAPPPSYQQQMPPAPPVKDKIEDIHDKLEKLEAMKQKNLITQDEYQSMRKQILG